MFRELPPLTVEDLKEPYGLENRAAALDRKLLLRSAVAERKRVYERLVEWKQAQDSKSIPRTG